MERVFVYGTLKKGQPNHFHLQPENGKAVFVGKGRTVEKWPLIVATRFSIPFLLDAKGKGKQVFGEMYDVDKQMMEVLDALEVHPHFYVREKILVENCETKEVCEAWCYLMKTYHNHLLESVTIENYDSFDGSYSSYVVLRDREQTTEQTSSRAHWLDHVQGEIYDVDEQMLKTLDRLEDHPNLYVRQKIPLELFTAENLTDGDRPVSGEAITEEAWCYKLGKFHGHLTEGPTIENYEADVNVFNRAEIIKDWVNMKSEVIPC